MKIFCVSLFLLPLLAWGQEPSKRLSEVKLYANLTTYSSPSIETDTNGFIVSKTYKSTNGLWLSPALTFSLRNKNFFEVELSRLVFTNNQIKNTVTNSTTGNTFTVYGSSEKNFSLHVRTEYHQVLFKNKDWQKFSVIAGLSLTPFINHRAIEPATSTEFSKAQRDIGVYLSLIPRVKYRLNEKWFIDFNSPVRIGTLDNSVKRTSNPTIPINKRRTNTTIYSSSIGVSLRFGIGLTI